MITALLLDLDDTLLDNPNAAFLPAYIKVLAQRLADFVPPEKFAPALVASTAAMLADRDPARTLREVFMERFFELTGKRLAEAEDRIGRFYREDFPSLVVHTGFKPEAREVVAWALAEGLQVGIGTNPVYPLTAIEQRLDWAGVGVNEFAYALVPSFETMHFGKPQPEYYTEMTALLGKRPGEVLMVGDDWKNDIVPAALAGLNTFWIAPNEAPPPADSPRPDGRGTLGDFLRWARDARCLESLTPLPPTPRSLLAGLSGHLAALIGAAGRVRDWRHQPGDGEWSLTEIMCHLRDVEAEVNLPRLRRVNAEAEPFIHAANTDPWAGERNYQAQDGPAALHGFVEARKATVAFLSTRPADYWHRLARHSILGRTSPGELITFTLEHDRIHLAQIKNLERA